MTRRGKAYVTMVVACGIYSVGLGLTHWRSENSALFFTILVLGVLGSFLKIAIPGIPGTMSMNFIFLMLAVTRLSLGESLAIAISATVIQTFWRQKKRQDSVIVGFNVALIAAVIAVSYSVFHSEWFRAVPLGEIVKLWIIAGIYFVLNTATVAGIIAITTGGRVRQIWTDSYGWSYAYFWLGASAVSLFNFIERAFGLEMALLALPVVFLAYRSYRMRIDALEKSHLLAEEQRKHAEEVATLHLRTIRALALAIEAKDTTTGQHLHRVQTYAMAIGRELALGEQELQALSAASILHDIGKIAVPEYIISKPGKLSREEFEKMKIHPTVGAEIAESVRFPYPVAPVVGAHHEKWDGSGYPAGLKGEEIPIGARILSAVDCLDALASDRQYRRAMPIEKAMDIVRSESGKAFDPRIVEILSRRFRELEALARTTAAGEMLQLSINVKCERGAAPDAGLEFGHISLRKRDSSGLDVLSLLADSWTESQALEKLNRSLQCLESVEELMTRLNSDLSTLLAFDSLVLFVREGELLRPRFTAGVDSELLETLRVPISDGLAGWVAEHRIPLINGNPATESWWNGIAPPTLKLKSSMAVPLETENGVTGVLALYSEQRDAFHALGLRLCLGLRSRLAFSLESALRLEAHGQHTTRCHPRELLRDVERLLLEDPASPKLISVIRIQGLSDEALTACVKSLTRTLGPAIFLSELGKGELLLLHGSDKMGVFEEALEELSLHAGQVPHLLVGCAEAIQDGSDARTLISSAVSRLRVYNTCLSTRSLGDLSSAVFQMKGHLTPRITQ